MSTNLQNLQDQLSISSTCPTCQVISKFAQENSDLKTALLQEHTYKIRQLETRNDMLQDQLSDVTKRYMSQHIELKQQVEQLKTTCDIQKDQIQKDKAIHETQVTSMQLLQTQYDTLKKQESLLNVQITKLETDLKTKTTEANEYKKVIDTRAAADKKAADEAKKIADAKALADKKIADEKAATEAKKAVEAKKAAEEKAAAEAKKATDAKALADKKVAEEAKKAAEAKALADKKVADEKAAIEAKKVAEAIKPKQVSKLVALWETTARK